MQIVLASYFEEDNHGPGRKIGISPGKPNALSYECELVFEPFSPGDLYWDYHRDKKEDYASAASTFINGYRDQLDNFFAELSDKAKEEDKEVTELLPFEDGDTLLSWEKKGNTSYRNILAEYLMEAGFDVEEN